jgi:hypothetical protein
MCVQLSVAKCLLNYTNTWTYNKYVFYFLVVNYILKHRLLTQSGFRNTLNLISSLYLVFTRFPARYRTISLANRPESISGKIKLNCYYITLCQQTVTTKALNAAAYPQFLPPYIAFFCLPTQNFELTAASEFTVLTLLFPANFIRGEQITKPCPAFINCY